VNRFDPVPGRRQAEHAEEAVRKIVVASGDGAIDLGVTQHAFDAVALLVDALIAADCDCTAGSWRDHGPNAARFETDADGIAVVTLVGDQGIGHADGDGDVIFFTPGENKRPEIFLGNECVVRLQFGRHLLKRVIHDSRKPVFTLITHSVLEMPDIVIEWAKPIRWIKRAVEAS
jgi:hypothetical protein